METLTDVAKKNKNVLEPGNYTVKKELDYHPDISGLHPSLRINIWDFNTVDNHPDLYGKNPYICGWSKKIHTIQLYVLYIMARSVKKCQQKSVYMRI